MAGQGGRPLRCVLRQPELTTCLGRGVLGARRTVAEWLRAHYEHHAHRWMDLCRSIEPLPLPKRKA